MYARVCLGDLTHVATALNLSPYLTNCARMLSLTLMISHSSAAIARAHLLERQRWTTISGHTRESDHFFVINVANLSHRHPSWANINEFLTNASTRSVIWYHYCLGISSPTGHVFLLSLFDDRIFNLHTMKTLYQHFLKSLKSDNLILIYSVSLEVNYCDGSLKILARFVAMFIFNRCWQAQLYKASIVREWDII